MRPAAKPARSYVICCVQRTGSWLLAHTLADTGYAGRPSDYFDEKERKTRTREWGLPSGDLTPYIAAVREHATTPNGVLGSKLMWNDFDWHRNSRNPPAGTDADLEFMRAAYPEAERPAAPDLEGMAQLVRLAQQCEDSVRTACRPSATVSRPTA